jgi:hypothetical protein
MVMKPPPELGRGRGNKETALAILALPNNIYRDLRYLLLFEQAYGMIKTGGGDDTPDKSTQGRAYQRVPVFQQWKSR